MCAVLRETASEYGIENVSIVESGWLDADVEPADVALCSHVVYVIEDIGDFVRKMDHHARRLVMAVVFEASPLSQVYGLWEAGPRRKAPRPAVAAALPAGAGRAGHPDPRSPSWTNSRRARSPASKKPAKPSPAGSSSPPENRSHGHAWTSGRCKTPCAKKTAPGKSRARSRHAQTSCRGKTRAD